MSAISALWQRSADPPPGVLLERMLFAQKRYGSDGTCRWQGRNIALGGNHLGLLPEDRFDQQPLWTPDRTACLVADVRLDNRPELIAALGLTAPDRIADSSILLAAWIRWDETCLDHIIGAFAFAVWIPGRQELFAARDHTGERPLFYHRGADFFALASMPKGLLALPRVPRTLNEPRIVDWMILTQPDWAQSFFEGIERLPLGHYLRVRPDRFEVKSYWHPNDAKPIRFRRDSDYPEALVEILDRTTAARLRSTGEIGSQLSAGLDSSTVTACAARLLGRRDRRLTAFTYVPQAGFLGKGYPGRLVYEEPGATEVARFYPNIDHVLIDSADYDLLADGKAWTDASDEPALNTINLLWITAILSEARKRNIRVMLQGVFGNSTISQEGRDNLEYYFRRGRWLKLVRHATSLRRNGDTSYKAAIIHATKGLLPMALKRRLRPAMNTLNLDYSSLSPELTARYDLFGKTFQRLHADLPDLRGQRKLFFERYDFGPYHAAVQARFGIEPRDPTSDKRVFDFCFGIPAEQYVTGYQSRSLVRRAMKGRLPESTLTRYKRGQQGVDWYLTVARALPSFREEFARIERSPLAQHFLDLPRVRTLLEGLPAIPLEGDEANDSWNYALTRAISLGYFVESNEPPTP